MRLYTKRNNKDFKAMAKLSLVALLCELPNLLVTAISALISNTPVVWVDTINSLSETLHCFIVFLVTMMLQKENSDKYNFGLDRTEVFSSFICDALVCVGMLAVLTGAIYGIIQPTAPTDNLLFFVLVKASNTLWDVVFLFVAIRAAKKAESRLSDSEVRNYFKALVFDVLIGIIVLVTYLFRDEKWTWYANPVASILLIIFFVTIYIKKLKLSIGELTDVSLPLDKQDEVFDIILKKHNVIKRIEEINCRKLNKKTYIEVCVIMNDHVTYQEQVIYLKEIRKEINNIIPDSTIKLIIGQDTLENLENKEN